MGEGWRYVEMLLDQFDHVDPVQANRLREPKERDWHAQRGKNEPRAAADQWRTRDRNVVMFMSEMSDSHLGHCIRFASTKAQHRSRLNALLAERAARSAK